MAVLPPLIDSILETDLSLNQAFLNFQENEEPIEGLSFFQEVGPKDLPSYLNMQNCLLQNCTFNQSQTFRSSFMNMRFVATDFSNISWQECRFERVEFVDCRFIGSNLTETLFKHVRFSSCTGELSNFAGAKMEDLIFEACDLNSASFSSSQFKRVDFTQCNLDNAEFLHTSLEKIDLRSCQIEGISLAGPELKGCKVTPLQAVSLAGLLGLIVEDLI
ncbi:MAG: pentapeptide repeat-containing protein [Firmicutes bacterium]|nr:pentapeptide repeat-containing protein [Bacillota bacterium]